MLEQGTDTATVEVVEMEQKCNLFGVCSPPPHQCKYKKDKEDLSCTLFSLLPETLETQFVKEMALTHSEVGKPCVCVCVISSEIQTSFGLLSGSLSEIILSLSLSLSL